MLDDPPHQHGRSKLVEQAHIDDVDAARTQQLALTTIDRADTEEIEVFRIHVSMRLIAEDTLKSWFTAQQRRRHSMHVAGWRRRGRIEIRVSVEPQHEKLAPDFRAVSRNTAHRAD